MKQLEVQIMQQSYLLGCPEGREARMLDAVARVDSAMCKIRDAGKIKARDRIAVLAALNLAFEVADHENAEAAAPVALPVTETFAPDTDAAPYDVRLANLLQRLDQSLGDDGQLL